MQMTTRPTLRGTFGMVSSTHWLAAQSAMSVLERGGNAFDAAVAGAFVLHVVEPNQCGPGGEVPAIIATADNPRPKVLCGQGVAPAAATIGRFRDELGLDIIPGSGLLAATVPGAVDGWLLLLRDHGTWSLRDVLDLALGYAASGHPLAGVSATIAGAAEVFGKHWPTSAAQWLPHGSPPADGTMMANPAYARTLQRLINEAEAAGADRDGQIERARAVWREGFVADAIDRFVRRPVWDGSGTPHAGVITGDDLARWSASWEAPATLEWQGWTVAKTQAWGQGPVLLQALSMLAASGDPREVDVTTADGVHVVTEALKLAFADREAWYGDAAEPPLSALLAADYAAERAGLIGAEASAELRPGSPDGVVPRMPSRRRLAGGPEKSATPPSMPVGTLSESASAPPEPGAYHGDTTHIDVVDRWGNMIAAMPSGGWLQSSPLIPELGFPLGTRLQMTWLEEGLASSLRPGRRPRTTLSPTMVSRDGQPVLAFGSPGGDQQDQWQLPFLLRHLVGGQTLQEAIDAPTWHTSSFVGSFAPREMVPASLLVEDRLGEEVIEALSRRGHRVRRTGDWSQGRLCAVARDLETGVLSAGANPRTMVGYAVGR